jgi:hypothetical protein
MERSHRPDACGFFLKFYEDILFLEGIVVW